MTYLSLDLPDMVLFLPRTAKSVIPYLHCSGVGDLPSVYEFVTSVAFDIPIADRGLS
jgi:hypothetical protein